VKRVSSKLSSNPKDKKTHAKAEAGKRFPAAKGLTLVLREGTLAAVREQMIQDGVSYVNDLVQILVLLWSNGRMSKRLASSKVTLSEGPYEEKLNVRVREDVLETAHEAARRAKFQGGSELWRYLLECYADGRFELCLRRGGAG